MCNEVKGKVAPATLTVEGLAKVLKEASAAADEINGGAFAPGATMARYLFERYVILPLDNVHACSGCATCVEAINKLDEARRDKVRADEELENAREDADCARRDYLALLQEARNLRTALTGLIGGETKEELEEMHVILTTMVAPEAPAAAAIRVVLNSPHTAPVTWPYTGTTTIKSCTVEENGAVCGEPALVPGCCYDHAKVCTVCGAEPRHPETLSCIGCANKPAAGGTIA